MDNRSKRSLLSLCLQGLVQSNSLQFFRVRSVLFLLIEIRRHASDDSMRRHFTRSVLAPKWTQVRDTRGNVTDPGTLKKFWPPPGHRYKKLDGLEIRKEASCCMSKFGPTLRFVYFSLLCSVVNESVNFGLVEVIDKFYEPLALFCN
jgi:hypothetical protein